MSEPTSQRDQPPGRRPGEVVQPESRRERRETDAARAAAGISLASAEVHIEPGKMGAVEVTVINHGNVVDEFALTVDGPPGDWATITPARISLMPGTMSRAVITFRPPRRSTLRAGPIEFVVRAASREVPEPTASALGIVLLGSFSESALALVPATARASGSTRFRLTVTNRGNARLEGTVHASDPDELLDLAVAPPRLEIEAGGSGVALVTSRPRRRIWFGGSQSRLVRVEFVSDDAAPVNASSSLVQLAVFGRRHSVALGTLAMAGIVLVAVAALALGVGRVGPPSAAPPFGLVATPTLTSPPSTTRSTATPTLSAPTELPPTAPPATQPPITNAPVTPEPTPPTRLTAGQALQLDGTLVSPGGTWTLVLQGGDGNLVIYPSGGDQARWSSNTSGCGVTVGEMQGDGNFVLYGGDVAIWATGAGMVSGSRVELGDDGQLVVVTPSGEVVWASDEHATVPDGWDPCQPHP